MIELYNTNKRQAFFNFLVIMFFTIGILVSRLFTFIGAGLLVISFVYKKWDSLPMLFLLLPFANVLKISPGTPSFFSILCLVYIIIDLLKKGSIKPIAILGPLSLFVYLIIVDQNGIELAVKIIIGIIFIYVFSNKNDIILIKICMLHYTDGLIISAILSRIPVFYERILPFMRIVYWKSGSDVLRSCGLFTDPNYYGMAIIMGIAAVTILYKNGDLKLGYWIRCGLLSAFGLLTYSKSFVLMLVFSVVFIMLFVVMNRRSPAFILLGLAICIFSYYAVNGEIESVNRVLYRFQTLDFTTGRYEKNIIYVNYICENIKVLLFGTGISIDRLPGMNNVHNFPIEAIQRIGIIGTAIYIFVISKCSKIIKAKNRNITCYMPIVVMTVFYLSLAGLTAYEFPFYVAICIVGLNYPYFQK